MNLELFSCSGGMAEGFRRAGIVFDLAFDADPSTCASYEANLGHRPIQMDVRDLLRMVRAGWRPSAALRFLVADPPCTPWSRAGKRQGTEDPRCMLRTTAELIALLRPDAYLIGNVPGLDDALNLPIVQKIIGGLSKHGYCVADYARLDAADFGVPQHRHRPFWFGHLSGPCMRWPEPTHCDPRELETAPLPGHEALKPWVTCREALGHIPFAELGRAVRLRGYGNGDQHSTPDRPAHTILSHESAVGGHWLAAGPTPTKGKRRRAVDGHPCSRPDEPAGTITQQGRCGGQRSTTLLFNDKHPPASLDAPAPTIGAKQRGAQSSGALALPRRDRHPLSRGDAPANTILASERQSDGGRTLEWPWDRPATSVAADSHICAPGHHDHAQRSDPNAVILSERAAAILQGFPEHWVFHGKTKTSRWSQLGQAMPPGFAEAVARSVRAQMETTNTRTEGT